MVVFISSPATLGKRWTSKPENTGLEKDFYTLEDMSEGEDQYFIEKSFAELETAAASVLDEIIDSRAIPKDKDSFDILINFIALAATRVPTMRGLISKPMEEIARMMAQNMVSSRERFEQSFPNEAAEGLTYETARRLRPAWDDHSHDDCSVHQPRVQPC